VPSKSRAADLHVALVLGPVAELEEAFLNAEGFETQPFVQAAGGVVRRDQAEIDLFDAGYLEGRLEQRAHKRGADRTPACYRVDVDLRDLAPMPRLRAVVAQEPAIPTSRDLAKAPMTNRSGAAASMAISNGSRAIGASSSYV
jgi:hypothetical protein